jgi:hypothetical protein
MFLCCADPVSRSNRWEGHHVVIPGVTPFVSPNATYIGSAATTVVQHNSVFCSSCACHPNEKCVPLG